LTEEENDEIKEAFELFDNDKDNELDYHEFKVKILKFLLIYYIRSFLLGWTSCIRF
jgi:Ca2+-binding EF-hand superfamily protein